MWQPWDYIPASKGHALLTMPHCSYVIQTPVYVCPTSLPLFSNPALSQNHWQLLPPLWSSAVSLNIAGLAGLSAAHMFSWHILLMTCVLEITIHQMSRPWTLILTIPWTSYVNLGNLSLSDLRFPYLQNWTGGWSDTIISRAPLSFNFSEVSWFPTMFYYPHVATSLH